MYADRDNALKAMRHERLRVSREKQKETKARREDRRRHASAAWQKRKDDEILHLGDDVSNGLNDLASRDERLAKWGLTDFATHEVARAVDGDHRRRTAVPRLRPQSLENQPLPPLPDAEKDAVAIA